MHAISTTYHHVMRYEMSRVYVPRVLTPGHEREVEAWEGRNRSGKTLISDLFDFRLDIVSGRCMLPVFSRKENLMKEDQAELRADVDRNSLAALDYLARMERVSLADLTREAVANLIQARYDSGKLPDGPWPVKKKEPIRE